MTITTMQDIIDHVDELTPNAIAQETKLEWLMLLETDLRRNVLDRYENPPDLNDTELCVPPPYQELYQFYLEAKIHKAHGEIERYDNSAVEFNAKRLEFEGWYNSTHSYKLPKRRHFI